MIVFTVIFGHFAKVPSEGVPYPIFSFCGLLPWTFFAYALSQSSNSLVGNSNLISKVYFPRLIIPIAATLSGLLDLAIAFLVLLALMVYYGIEPTIAVVTLPLFVAFSLIAALAVGVWLSALNVEYRDVRYATPFLTQIWMYATPIVYPLSLIHNATIRFILSLNPMTGVVDGFRWAMLGTNSFDGQSLGLSATCAIVGLLAGLIYFRRMERQFADVV
jgi:lipopolysaccharide transport system permease protein